MIAMPAPVDVPTSTVRIVHTYPHDRRAFTEGLYYEDGYLFESTGGYADAGLRKVRLETGEVVQRRDVPRQVFGEGIVASGSRILQLSWREGVGFVYDRTTFALLGEIHYPGEGWAMTRNAAHIFMSDGTPRIRILDPQTFAQTGSIDVTVDGKPLEQVNELEWVKGEIYANVWQTSRIARIDPSNGHVVGWIDLGNLAAMQHVEDPADDVLNGIAYDAAHDRLFVTGKRWDAVYEIRINR
jgi:glutaminyl-peptide cyclotransferase